MAKRWIKAVVKLVTNHSQTASWWMQRWHALLADQGIDPKRTLHTSCLQHIEISSGTITAQVTDPATQKGGPVCTVEIKWPPLNDAEWQRIFDALSSQALFSAQLLAGEFPPEIDRVFADADLSLLPESLREWRVTRFACAHADPDVDNAQAAAGSTEPDAALQRRVLAVVYTVLGDMFREEPWLLFQLRGRTQQQILHALREQRQAPGPDARSAETDAVVNTDDRPLPFFSAHAQPDNARSALPLFDAENAASQVDEFWGTPKQLKSVQYRIEPPAIDLALLRRLGPPPFSRASLAVYDHLANVYQQVSAQAMALAYATEPEGLDEEDAD